MRRTIVTLGVLAVVLFLSAERGHTFADSPRLFDEFGSIRAGDRSARLDNYAIQLLHDSEAYGYVVVYAPESASKRISQDIIDYLTRTRSLSRERIKTYHAGYNDPLTEPLIQLYILPKGVAAPKPLKRDVNLARFKGMLAEYQKSDYIQLNHPLSDEEEDPEKIGPPVGNVTYAAFDDVLKAQKHSVAHVVAFNGVADVPGTWRRVAESTVEDLKSFGFESSRFKIGYGGTAKETRVQLWILPPGEMPPVKDPASEPQSAKAIQLGDFDHETMGYANNETAIFNRLVAVMRENPGLRACLIVRMDESADLPKLVEKWKSDLAAKHKIRADRIVILFANAQEHQLGSIEVWVVPQGRPLPDVDQ